MLAVAPPLHQDFRARHALCSPGDGWRAYKPPPPVSLGPAFHFLSLLLDPEAYAPTIVRPPPRQTLNKQLYGKLERIAELPNELLCSIADLVVESGHGVDLAKSSKSFHNLVQPMLYRTITLNSTQSIVLLNRTLEAHPYLALNVREIHLNIHRLPWTTEMAKLCSLLRPDQVERRQIESITLNGMPASDLHQAIPFLHALSPKALVWTTSPCWQMRPSHLFVEAFTHHTMKLDRLTLANFQFDDTLVEIVGRCPTLQQLTLSGSGTQRMDESIFGDILGDDDARRQPDFQLNVSNCTLERRAQIEARLSGDPASSGFFSQQARRRLSWI